MIGPEPLNQIEVFGAASRNYIEGIQRGNLDSILSDARCTTSLMSKHFLHWRLFYLLTASAPYKY